MRTRLYKPERRFFDRLAGCRVVDEDNGSISGAANVLGILDAYRTVFFPGYFSDPLLADFLQRGFVSDAHDWAKPIGMPLVAEVRGRELYTEGAFHSDPESQIVRVRARERIANGLEVGQSIGFLSAEERPFKNGRALIDFAEAQRYDMSLFDIEGIIAWRAACRGMLQGERLFEYAIVTVPANELSVAKDVRGFVMPVSVDLRSSETKTEGSAMPATSNNTAEKRGQYLGDDIESQMTICALSRLMDRLFYRVLYGCICGTYDYDYDEDDWIVSRPPLNEALVTIAGAIDEFKEITLTVVEAIMSGADDAETPQEAAMSLRAWFGDPEKKDFVDGARAARSFEAELDAALAAARSCKTRAQAIAARRSAETPGRSISTARIAQMRALVEEFQALLEELPKPPAYRADLLRIQAVSISARLLAAPDPEIGA